MAYKLLETSKLGCSTRTMRRVSTNVAACVALDDNLSPLLSADPLLYAVGLGIPDAAGRPLRPVVPGFWS
jgi:hypothetical protein